ncbi:MAG: FtsX-like permease family protein [Promethearchaeota archaeon]
MFRYIILLASGLGFLYFIVKNVLYSLEQRKKARKTKEVTTGDHSGSKISLIVFGYRYASNYLRSHRKRAAVLLVGFITATSIVTSAFLWTEVVPYVVVKQGLENQAFPLILRPESITSAPTVFEVKRELENKNKYGLVETMMLVRQTVGLYGVENELNSFIWLNAPYIGEFYELFIIPEDYLSYVENQFTVNGSFKISENDVVISRRLATKLEIALNRTIEVGSLINVTLGQRFPDMQAIPPERYLIDWDPYHLLNKRVAGIYVRKPVDQLVGDSYSEDTLGEALFISENALPEESLNKISLNGDIVTTRLFVRLDQTKLVGQGIANIIPAIENFAFRVEVENGGSIIAEFNTAYITSLVDTYLNSSMIASYLLIPSFFSAFVFILFSSRLFYEDREEEIKVLMTKGASTFQLFYGLIMEVVILALIGSFLGVIISIGNMFLMTGANTFLQMTFNLDLFNDTLNVMISKPWLWIIPALICSAVFIFSVVYQINNYLKTEDVERKETSKKFHQWITDNYLDILVLIGAYIGLIFLTAVGFLDFFLVNTVWLATVLIFVLGIWIGVTLVFTKVQVILGRLSTYFLIPVLRNRAIFVHRNFQRRQSQIIALGTILILSGSICLFSLSYQETIQNHTEKVVNFTMGVDLKIETEIGDPDELVNRLTNITEIINATPVFESSGFIGERLISIRGFDPQIYSVIIEEKISDADLQQNWMDALKNLNESSSEGIIINSLIAQRNNLEIGDNVVFQTGQDTYQMRIIDIFSNAPGFGSLSANPETQAGIDYGTVFISAYSPLFNNSNARNYFCKVKSDTDFDSLVYRLYSKIPEITQIQIHDYKLENVGFLSLTGIIGSLSFNFILAIFLFFLTMVIFFAHVIDRRRGEYAILRVCGARSKDLYKVISSEGILIIGISFLISIILGLTFSWIFAKISVRFLPFYNALPLTFDFPIYFVILLTVLILFAILLATIYPSRRVKGQSIPEIIKNL